ncbi:MAG: type II toxin-antitoxin system HicA family toxin [Candidatus Daviesbacteria bacterium]|nr:type II toxin-antitoxin system HicA family toxin [Candidatus Daviesbacteria bacterium]
MNKLSRNVKPQRLIKFLEKLGFQKGKGKGSHIRLTHHDGRWTQVAVHPGPVPQGTLKKITRQAELTDKQVNDLK